MSHTLLDMRACSAAAILQSGPDGYNRPGVLGSEQKKLARGKRQQPNPHLA